MEPRWPIAVVVGSYLALMIVLRIYSPDRPAFGTRWLVPGILGGLLVALILADPAKIEGRARWLRRVASVLILSLAAVGLVATAILIGDLIDGAEVAQKASTLLVSGALIWLETASSSASSTGTSTPVAHWLGIAATTRTATSRSPST